MFFPVYCSLIAVSSDVIRSGMVEVSLNNWRLNKVTELIIFEKCPLDYVLSIAISQKASAMPDSKPLYGLKPN